MQQQINKFDFTGQKIYVGCDVHKKSWSVSIMSENLLLKTFSQPPKPDILANYLMKNYPGAEYHTAYEAGFSGFWIHYTLQSYGFNSIVVNAADIPTTVKEVVMKEDSRDSLKIAKALRANLLNPIYIPSAATVDERSLVRARSTITKDLAMNKNRVKSFLNLHGIEIPSQFDYGSKSWSRNFITWLTNLEFKEKAAKDTLTNYIENCLQMKNSKLKVTRQIKELSKTEKYLENMFLLLTVPGVGLITAMELLTELETISRFPSVDRLFSYIGFVPSTHSSGEKERTGNITPRGHSILRSALIESAWVAVSRDPALTKKYEQLLQKMTGKRAIIRIAKKLTGLPGGRQAGYILFSKTKSHTKWEKFDNQWVHKK